MLVPTPPVTGHRLHCRQIILFAVIASSSSNVSASPLALQDEGLVTYDPNTGLRWLDLTESRARNYLDVSSQFGLGGDYATAEEVGRLFTNAGVVLGSATQGNAAQTLALINLLGRTSASNIVGGFPYVMGITADLPCQCALAVSSNPVGEHNLHFLATAVA